MLNQTDPRTTGGINPNPSTPIPSGTDAKVTNEQSFVRNLGLSMLPFTPVPMQDPTAWVRIGIYGLVAMGTWRKARPVAYVATSAAAISLATSLGASAWNGRQ